jgi:hypothetical protein
MPGDGNEAGGAVKTALEAIQTAMEALHLNPQEKEPRAGPLVVVGRFYISLTVILVLLRDLSAT